MIDFNFVRQYLFIKYLEEIGYSTSELLKLTPDELDELYIRFVQAHTKNFNGSH